MFRATRAPSTGYNFTAMASCPTRYPAGQMPPLPATFTDLPYAMVGDGTAGKQEKGAKVPGGFEVGDKVRVIKATPYNRIGDALKVGDIGIIEEDDRTPYVSLRVVVGEKHAWCQSDELEHADLEPLAEGQLFRIGDRVRFTDDVDILPLTGKTGTVTGFRHGGSSSIHTHFEHGTLWPYFVKSDDPTVFKNDPEPTMYGHSSGCVAVNDSSIEQVP